VRVFMIERADRAVGQHSGIGSSDQGRRSYP
jgi:hypothetical protein